MLVWIFQFLFRLIITRLDECWFYRDYSILWWNFLLSLYVRISLMCISDFVRLVFQINRLLFSSHYFSPVKKIFIVRKMRPMNHNLLTFSFAIIGTVFINLPFFSMYIFPISSPFFIGAGMYVLYLA